MGTWLREPAATAAIGPSGRRLAALMTAGLRADGGPVLELGPGTGAFTRAVLARGLSESQLCLVEREPAFAERLRRQHPQALLLQMDARGLRHLPGWGDLQAQAVLSGLPLLTMGLRAQLAIVGAALRALQPGGALLQFTYQLHCPVAPAVLQRLGLRAERLGGTWLNLPPASVYAIHRR